MLMAGAESQRLPFTLHDDYAPNWDFTFGGSKIILTCSLNEMTQTSLPHAQLHVSFGGEQASPEVTPSSASQPSQNSWSLKWASLLQERSKLRFWVTSGTSQQLQAHPGTTATAMVSHHSLLLL